MLLPPTDKAKKYLKKSLQDIFTFLYRVALRSLLLQKCQPMAPLKQVEEVQKIPKIAEHKGTKFFWASMLQQLSLFLDVNEFSSYL